MTSDMPSERLPGTPPPGEDGEARPPWDREYANWLIGKYALVGIMYLANDETTVMSQAQYHGRIVATDKDKGIMLACEGKRAGETFRLPPMTSNFHVADPGEYKLRASDEVVTNPDVLATWSVIAAPKPS